MKRTILATLIAAASFNVAAYNEGGTPPNEMPSEVDVQALLEAQNFASGQDLLDFVSGDDNMTTEEKVVMVNAKLANYTSEDGQTVQLEYSNAQEGWKLQRRDSEGNQDDSFFLEDDKGSWQDPHEKARAIEQIKEYGELKHGNDGLPVQDPKFGEQTTVEQKQAVVEKMFDNAGSDYTVSVVDGELLVQDSDSKDVTGSDLTKLLRETAKNNNQDFLPVPPTQPTNVEKAEMFNKKMADMGIDAKVVVDAEGTATYVFNGVNGKRSITLNDLSESQLSEIKDLTRDGIKNDLITLPNPDNGEDDAIPTPVSRKEVATQKVKEFQATATLFEKRDAANTILARSGSDYQITDFDDNGETMVMTDKEGNIYHVNKEQFNAAAAQKQQENQAKRGGKVQPPVEDMPTPIAPIEDAPIVEPVQPGELGQGRVISHSQAAQAQTQNQIDELYALGNQNASDIDTLFSEVDRLDTRIDQTQALNAATVNARPMVANGMTAFGAGVGYAGSEAALAIGVAHSFVDTGWSASGTLAASSDDVVVGGGVQYAF